MLQLSDESVAKLMALRNGPGYPELVDVMEKICLIQETELLAMDPAGKNTPAQILSMQAQCRAGRGYFQGVKREIDEQIAGFTERQNQRAAASIPDRPMTNDELLGFLELSAEIEEP